MVQADVPMLEYVCNCLQLILLQTHLGDFASTNLLGTHSHPSQDTSPSIHSPKFGVLWVGAFEANVQNALPPHPFPSLSSALPAFAGQPIAQPAVAGATAQLHAARRGGHQPPRAAAAPGEAGGRGVGAVGGGDGLGQGRCGVGVGGVGWMMVLTGFRQVSGNDRTGVKWYFST